MFKFSFEFGRVEQAEKESIVAPHTPQRWDVFLVTLPQQNMEHRGENGKPLHVTTTEMSGDHRIVVLKADGDGRYVVGVPMTSARNSGGEKWNVWKPSWYRAAHGGEVVCIQTEQIRYVDRVRLLKPEGSLGLHDQQKIEEKLRALLTL